jgi:alpha-glucosidase
MDANNDGIGDIKGITSKLDYIKELGVNAIWLSPFYPSPMHDFGYDVADYCDVNEMFGCMDDFEEMLAEAHKRDIKVIIDLVPNHTSSEHQWFKESVKSKDNPKRDWYIWRDPAPDGGPPNNWLSHFGGSAWTLDEDTKQYYLHLFVKEQPDLNYRNPEVRKAMLDVIKFWLDKGIDGFRVDVIVCMMKDEKFRNNPLNPDWDGKVPFNKLKHIHTSNLPEVHSIIKDMRSVLDEYGDDKVMIGETYLPYTELLKYYGENQDECHMPFNFHLLEAKWKADVIKKLVDDYDDILPEDCWPSYVLGNHDQKRIATKVGEKQKRVAAMMLLTLRGAPTVYYGEELGMHNVKIPKDKIQDPPAVNQPEIADLVGRDPERTPMQWNSSPNAGFSKGGVEPWLPVADDYKEENVTIQNSKEDSMLNFFKKLTKLRAEESSFSVGKYIPVKVSAKNVFAYKRESDNAEFAVVLNFDSKEKHIDLSNIFKNAEVVLSTKNTKAFDMDFTLKADEGIIFRIIE